MATPNQLREVIVHMVEKGNLSYKKVAEQLEITRSTVAGIMFRHRTTEATACRSLAAKHSKKVAKRRLKPPPPPKMKKVTHEPTTHGKIKSRGVHILDRTSCQCAWVIDQPPGGAIMCGNESRPGSSYCQAHHDICTRQSVEEGSTG